VTTAGALGAAPVPPGSLTKPPAAREVLLYLDAFGKWVVALRGALDNLDARAQVAQDPGAYTQDIVLAMSLWNSIDARRQEIERVWDSGRVLENELAQIATLIWGRLTDPLGAPSAFTLPEACTLVAALNDRLTAVLAADAVAGSGAAARIEPLRAALKRCHQQATLLGRPVTRIEELSAELEAAVKGSNPTLIGDAVTRIDAEVAILERDLIKEAATRAGIAFQQTELRKRYDDLVAKIVETNELAARCREKIVNPPNLAVPSVAALGEPPAADTTNANATRAALEKYAEQFGRIAAAVSVAHDRYQAPLQEREDLRGLLGAYHHRMREKGLSEDAALDDRYKAAHAVLYSAPCDLAAARDLVREYQEGIRLAVGADVAVEPRATNSKES
jgi:hypothetical protein